MIDFRKWFYPGIKMKRWIFLIVLSVIVLVVGLSGNIGSLVRNVRFDAINIDHVFKKLQQLKFIDYLLLTLGIIGIGLAVRRVYFSVISLVAPNREKEYMNMAYLAAKLRRGPKLAAIGGGTGMPNVLRGMKFYTSNISAIVTVADDGGSTGKIRKHFHMPAPGDVRNCIVALSDEEALIGKLFQYRFEKGGTLKGHSFGNIFLTAMTDVVGDFSAAVDESSKVLATHGKVLPVTLEEVKLKAKMKNGKIIKGQSRITQKGGAIERIFITPADCAAYEPAIEAIRKADIIAMGPGSLYTSVIPNLLVPGVVDAINRSRAVKVYVCNIMTQKSETHGYRVSDHVKAIFDHAGSKIIDIVIANNALPADRVIQRYAGEEAKLVETDRENVKKLGVKLVEARLFEEGEFIRHSPKLLAKVIMKASIV